MTRTIVAAALAAAFSLTGYSVGFAYATPSPGIQCARSLSLAKQNLLRADLRLLNRCALSVADKRPAFPAETRCSPLRTPGKGIDRHERTARRRIEARCRRALPTWLPVSCRGAGPWNGRPLENPADVAECAVRTTHCTAAGSLLADYENAGALLASQNPRNINFEYADASGNNFASCLEFSSPGSTTTSTMPDTTTTLPQQTTTTLLQPTTTTTILTPLPPRLLITELMNNPAAQSDSKGEYFEVWNPSAQTVDLLGLLVSDLGSDAFTVDVPLQAAPGAFVVFAKSPTAADGKGSFVYGGAMTLANGTDSIVLSLDGTELDRVAYDGGFPLTSGASMQLKPTAFDVAANDDPANWCVSLTAMGDGDLGTPAAANDDCAP